MHGNFFAKIKYGLKFWKIWKFCVTYKNTAFSLVHKISHNDSFFLEIRFRTGNASSVLQQLTYNLHTLYHTWLMLHFQFQPLVISLSSKLWRISCFERTRPRNIFNGHHFQYIRWDRSALFPRDRAQWNIFGNNLQS